MHAVVHASVYTLSTADEKEGESLASLSPISCLVPRSLFFMYFFILKFFTGSYSRQSSRELILTGFSKLSDLVNSLCPVKDGDFADLYLILFFSC